MMGKAVALGLPLNVELEKLEIIRKEFGVEFRTILDDIHFFFRLADRALGTANIHNIASYIHLPAEHPLVIQLFSF